MRRKRGSVGSNASAVVAILTLVAIVGVGIYARNEQVKQWLVVRTLYDQGKLTRHVYRADIVGGQIKHAYKYYDDTGAEVFPLIGNGPMWED